MTSARSPEDGTAWLAMEYLEGETLADRLKAHLEKTGQGLGESALWIPQRSPPPSPQRTAASSTATSSPQHHAGARSRVPGARRVKVPRLQRRCSTPNNTPAAGDAGDARLHGAGARSLTRRWWMGGRMCFRWGHDVRVPGGAAAAQAGPGG